MARNKEIYEGKLTRTKIYNRRLYTNEIFIETGSSADGILSCININSSSAALSQPATSANVCGVHKLRFARGANVWMEVPLFPAVIPRAASAAARSNGSGSIVRSAGKENTEPCESISQRHRVYVVVYN